MNYYNRQGITSAIKILIFINIFVFLLQNIFGLLQMSPYSLESLFALDYIAVMYEYRFWQIFTYMFLHANWWHLLFNMLALYFIGNDVERELGSRPFIQYYLASGLGAGVFIFLADMMRVFIDPNNISYLGVTLGASGAIFGLILVFSILFKDRYITLLLFFVLPVTIRGKNLLIISLLLSIFFPLLFGGNVRISHSGHIGGAIAGLLFLFLFRKNPYFVHTYYSLTQWWRSYMGEIRKPRVNREYFNADSRYPSNSTFKTNNSHLDENQMTEREIEDKIDQLLDIISDKGIQGLNEKEKRFLERVSKLYRHKFPN